MYREGAPSMGVEKQEQYEQIKEGGGAVERGGRGVGKGGNPKP